MATDLLILGAAGVFLLPVAAGDPRAGPARSRRRRGGALGEVGAYLRANRKTVLCHNFGFACLSFAAATGSGRVPTFFVRTHGWDAGHVGVVYGSIVAVFGLSRHRLRRAPGRPLAKRGRSDANMRVGLPAAWAVIPLHPWSTRC